MRPLSLDPNPDVPETTLGGTERAIQPESSQPGFPGRRQRWHCVWSPLFWGSRLSHSSHRICALTSIMAWDSSSSAEPGSQPLNQGPHLPQTPQPEVRGHLSLPALPWPPGANGRGGIRCSSLHCVRSSLHFLTQELHLDSAPCLRLCPLLT